MNNDSGARTEDVQMGICETGLRGGQKVSRERQEQACDQVNMNPPFDYTPIFITAILLLLVIISAIVFGFTRSSRSVKKNSNKRLK